MNAKIDNVVLLLKQKLNTLISLFPAEIGAEIKKSCYFAGGCIYSLYHDQEPKDYDIFCSDKNLIERILAWCKGTNTYDRITENAISINEFQIVIKHYGPMSNVVEQFDFHHNMFAFNGEGIIAFTDFKYLEDEYLHFNESRARDIASTITRIPKFVGRGMKMSRKEVAKILNKLCDEANIEQERESITRFVSSNRDGY